MTIVQSPIQGILFDKDGTLLDYHATWMPLNRQAGVLGLHPFAVVFDPDQLLAAELYDDNDPPGAGVDRVLDQLLDHRCRALDHFAGGDLVGQVGWQNVNAPHQIQRLRRKMISMPAEMNSMIPAIHQN